MVEVKNTRRAEVHVGYDGRVRKFFRGHMARERFDNEVQVLKYLESVRCPFVPRVLDTDPDRLLLVTTNVGRIVETISKEKENQLFKSLEAYGVRHQDQDKRNITYDIHQGKFCIIDFEFATILTDPTHRSPVAWPHTPDKEQE